MIYKGTILSHVGKGYRIGLYWLCDEIIIVFYRCCQSAIEKASSPARYIYRVAPKS